MFPGKAFYYALFREIPILEPFFSNFFEKGIDREGEGMVL